MKLKDVKKGEYFKTITKKGESSTVYVRDDYDREDRKYWVYKFDDVNDGRLMDGNKEVTTDFIF